MQVRGRIKIKDAEVRVLEADITDLEVDAIVNPANNRLIMDEGLAAAIRRKGGEIIQQEAIEKGPIKVGQAIATSAGRLKAKYVIHAATMGMDFKTDEKKIRSATANAFIRAQDLKIESIAFPALWACGKGGIPYEAGAKIMSQEVLKYFRCLPNASLKKILFVVYGKGAYEPFRKGIIRYLEYIQDKIQQGPFCTVDVIIELGQKIALIKRKNPPFGWAIPGGFVNYGESLEEAARREAEEETGLSLVGLRQFQAYSRPDRDPRFHTISTVFIAKAKGRPRAATDAAEIKAFSPRQLPKEFAFDHKEILKDYFRWKRAGPAPSLTKRPF